MLIARTLRFCCNERAVTITDETSAGIVRQCGIFLMVLICGSVDDPLVRELLSLCHGWKLEAQLLDEGELFGSCQLALERQGALVQGFLQARKWRVDLKNLECAVLRLPRVWWPSQEFDLQDQMFVYHETLASWFALWDALECPLVNHFGLGWSVQDLSYPLELRLSLARHLAVKTSEMDRHHLEARRLGLPRVESIYRAGGVTFAGPGCSSNLMLLLAKCEVMLSEWERDTGVTLSRIDFERLDTLRLKWVEVFPTFRNEPRELVRGITSAILSHIPAGREVSS
jgi:hypothetical protein